MTNINGDKTNIRRLILYFLPVIVILIVGSYWRMLDNFFYSDDFEWLDQVRNLEHRPLTIFNPVVHPSTAQLTPLGPNYFSPLVHIIFWINYKLFALNPLGYHLFDLALHIINSCLVVYFVYFLVGNQVLATLTGLFFALNFAVTDAVIWSGALVDTVMFTFYTLSLIAFLFFLRNERHSYYIFSIFLFILSLSAKGTALALPFALFFIEKHCKPKAQINQLFKYLPFIFIVLVYIVLLRYNTPGNLTLAQTDISRIILNIIKVPMTLFIPEGLVPVNPWMTLLYVLMFLPVIAFVVKRETTGIGHLGILFLMFGVLPLIPAAWDFPSNPDPFNMSIRHRLYLGNLGSAMFIGGVVYYFYSSTDKALYKAISIMLVLTLIGWNIFWNQKIQHEWDEVSRETKSATKEIETLIGKKPHDSIYYFINFPPRQGFAEKLFKIFYEPYDLRYGIWPSELPSHIDREEINFIIQIKGHLYSNPKEAEKAASTPWEHFYVAQFYILAGNNTQGLIELEKAIIPASDEKLHYLIATTYKKAGLNNKVIEELKKVAVLDRTSKYSIASYRMLGAISFYEGDHDSAIKYLEKAVHLNKRDAESIGNLAQLYETKGEFDKGREMWERALIHENREEIRIKIKERLARVENDYK